MACKLDNPADAQRCNIAVNRWAGRAIPSLLAGTVGYANYVLVYQLCVKYLLRKHHDNGAAIAILVVHFLLFLLMAASFFRLSYLTFLHPPLVPLGPGAIRARNARRQARDERDNESSIGGSKYGDGNHGRDDPDSPGLELFYSKDVFVCEIDGKPIWCADCQNWKPDRTHHDSSSNRCVRKLDHFCPWVGGPVGENNMKFFIQFTFYTAMFCLHLLVVLAFYIHQQKSSESESVNRHLIAILALAVFFGLFTASMFGTCTEGAMKNETAVENLQLGNRRRIFLAVFMPSLTVLQSINPTLASNPPYQKIVYPLPRDDSSVRSTAIENGALAQNELGQPRPSPPTSEQGATAVLQESGLNAIRGAETSENPSQPRTLRDLQATRQFAILSMADYANPWDLGSWHENLKTVMGTSIIDWFLPLRMSPCCNHDSEKSQFPFGPHVDDVKRNAGLLPQNAPHSAEVPEIAQKERVRRHRKRDLDAPRDNALLAPQALDKLDEHGRKQRSNANSFDTAEGT